SASIPKEISTIFQRDGSEAPVGCCQQRVIVGPCRASFPRWFYNSTADECQFFYFGGCWGNCNNFQSEAACEANDDGGEEKGRCGGSSYI
ncbi:serine protease inhibitor, putative, partial [Ixodes scapularis]